MIDERVPHPVLPRQMTCSMVDRIIVKQIFAFKRKQLLEK